MTPRLAQMRRGKRAFERLYRRHVADVYRYALVLLRDPHDAEHVTQTTFLNAYRVFDRGERPRNSRAWLLALAHAACRQQAGPDIDDEDDERAASEAGPPSPSEVRRALAHLPFNERAALVMRELESRSYAEIAEVLELSPADVETLVFQARRALREQLEGALSCHEAERAVSRQLDGRLARAERKPLRRHLRECAECARFGRSQRAQRSAWKVLASVPLPPSLQSFFGAGGVMETTLGRGADSVALAAVAKTLAVATIGISGIAMLHESLGYGTPGPTLPALSLQDAPSARPATPTGRPTATAEQIKAAPRPKAPPSRPPARAPTPIAVQPTQAHPKAVATKRAATRTAPRSQAIQIRSPATAEPVGQTQTAAASESVHRPTAPPAPAEPQVAPQIVPPAPAPALQVPGVPSLPPAPPLPLPPPHLP